MRKLIFYFDLHQPNLSLGPTRHRQPFPGVRMVEANVQAIAAGWQIGLAQLPVLQLWFSSARYFLLMLPKSFAATDELVFQTSATHSSGKAE